MTTTISLSFFACALLFVPLHAQGLESLDRVTRVSAVEREGHHYASLAGRLLDPEGKPLVGARAILMGYQAYYWALPLGEATSDAEGRFRIDGIVGTGKPQLWVQTPKGMSYAIKGHRAELIDGQEVEFGDWKPFAKLTPATDPTKSITIRGVILDNQAKPVPMAFVRLEGEGKAYDPGAYAFTDKDGKFQIESRTSSIEWMSIFTGGRRFRIKHDASKREMGTTPDGWRTALSVALSGEEIELKLEELQAIPLPGSTGKSDLSYFWNFAGQLHRWRAKNVFLARSQYGSSLEVLVSREGHLPRPLKVSLDREGKAKVKAPYFGKSRIYELRFRGLSEQEARQVKLDVSLLRGEREDTRTFLGSFALDAEGSLRLAGMDDAVYEVYAYLDGHDPIQAWWIAGKKLQLGFTPRTHRVDFRSAGKGRSMRIKLPGSFRPITILALDKHGEASCSLAPGSYETSLYDAENKLISARSMTVKEGKSATQIDLGIDERPLVTLLLPEAVKTEGGQQDKNARENAWHVVAKREAIGGMVSDWAASSGGRTLRSGEEPVIVRKKRNGQYKLRFPSSGNFFLYCGQDRSPGRYFLPLDLTMGDKISPEFPKRPSTLEAKTSNYHPSMYSQHGTAGPRFFLWPDRATGSRLGWGIFIGLPSIEDDGRFRIRGLPSGRFTLFHHLAGKTVEYTDSKGRKDSYNKAEDIWGGQPVHLAPSGATDLGELTKEGMGTLHIRLEHKAGQPIRFGYVEVRDPMFDSWSKVIEGGSTRGFAQDPIPAPPRSRIQLGESLLPNIRKGRLLLRVLLPHGIRITLERDVVPGQTLELRLPIPH